MTTDLKDTLAGLKVGDYVTAIGVDTRGHSVTRTGTLLSPPKEVTATRNGKRAKGVRVCVGAAGVDPSRSTWTTLFPDSGTVDLAREPKADEWSNTELRMVPGIRAANLNARIYFGGKGGKRSTEPREPVVLAEVTYTGEGKYEICDADSGDVLHTCTLQSQIWWLPAPVGKEPQAVGTEDQEHNGHQEQGQDVTEYGQPVYHVETRKIVGYLRPDRFTPIEDVRAQDEPES
ncbi:hypothetical protein OHA61_30640 [Streptomyces sp. NBC_00885]|uniref:hypothetical protein n=1 Tax=Streptomyces sp. NBC_00885 TaxID=2975857 RepID=UPI00386BE980|nr:hypothetical protein OHA61_30640 [Streptomyces sp. NBC_00885]